MNQGDTLLHLVAGGIGGTVGAIITCPLEVIKTRLQSSAFSIRTVALTPSMQFSISTGDVIRPENNPPRVLKVLRNILEKEGARSLFRGLGPNLVGVAPTRAIYFGAYASAKEGFSRVLEPGTAMLHICAATIAGFISITATNPMWVIKTRLQLDTSPLDAPGSSTLQCMRRIYHSEGLRGFYRGMSASYAGISETVIYFVVYEELKRQLKKGSSTEESLHFFGIMGAGTVSKICASCIAYPHEVVRTRLREEGNRYHSFIQTVRLVAAEEGIGAFYRGLLAQLARQIPNTAVMMATYELIVHLAKETRGPEAAAMSIAEGRNE